MEKKPEEITNQNPPESVKPDQALIETKDMVDIVGDFRNRIASSSPDRVGEILTKVKNMTNQRKR